MCAWACMHARVCMRVCAQSHIDKDDLVHKLHYDAVNKLYHIIYLSFRFSLYLPIYIYAHIHAHTYIYMCVCVCV